MKRPILWLGLGTACLLTACSTPNASLPPVGPSPASSASSGPGTGQLVVYSAWSCFNNDLIRDHSGYMVYAPDGKLVKWVPNAIEGDYTLEQPTRVSLPAGTYNVKAEGGQYGWVMVPTVIHAGQTTCIYLDGESHGIDSAAHQKDVVKLPDGEVVGWAANPAG